jgi:dienelactone hydrolase
VCAAFIPLVLILSSRSRVARSQPSQKKDGRRMAFQYFPATAMYSQGIMLALNAGGDINDIDRALRSVQKDDGVPDLSAWYESLSALAGEVAAQASADEAAGRLVSAGHKHRRACIYYVLAERYLEISDKRKPVAYRAMREQFAAYVACSGEPVEFIEVPYEGTSLPGIFIPAGGGEKAPTVLFIDGFDIYKEIMYLRRGDQARARGLNLFIVDTPGVGEALRLRGIPTRFDSEVPVAACIDYLETRADVDPDRIGLMGISLGGYYAPRAASFEKRVKCCAAWGAAFDVGSAARRTAANPNTAMTVPRSQFLWVTGTSTPDDALRVTDDFTLAPVLSQLTVPLLILQGEDDHVAPWEQAEQTAAAAVNSPRVDLVRGTAALGGAGHCSMDSMESGVDILYDWFAEILSALPAGTH